MTVIFLSHLGLRRYEHGLIAFIAIYIRLIHTRQYINKESLRSRWLFTIKTKSRSMFHRRKHKRCMSTALSCSKSRPRFENVMVIIIWLYFFRKLCAVRYFFSIEIKIPKINYFFIPYNKMFLFYLILYYAYTIKILYTITRKIHKNNIRTIFNNI